MCRSKVFSGRFAIASSTHRFGRLFTIDDFFPLQVSKKQARLLTLGAHMSQDIPGRGEDVLLSGSQDAEVGQRRRAILVVGFL